MLKLLILDQAQAKRDVRKLFTQPFTERETQRQYIVNKKNGQSPGIMINVPFLRRCAETAHYEKKAKKSILLLYSHHSCAGSQFLPENQLGHARQFPVCRHVKVVGPQCSREPKGDFKTVERPEVSVFGEAPAAEKSKRPASASHVPEDAGGWND